MSAASRAMQGAPALLSERLLLLPTRHRWLRWVIFGASLAFSAGSTYFFYLKIQDEARARFAKSAISVVRDVESRIRANEDLLHAMRGLFDAANQVTREDFHEFAEALALPRRYPGITNINFAIHVSGGQKREFEGAVRAEKSRLTEGLPEFSIKPPGERPEYIVLHYIEPLTRSAIVWGSDLNSDPQRRSALQRARDTGQIASTSGITLESDKKSRVASLLFRFAVYHGKGVPNTLEERQRLYWGVVGSTIRIGEMVESALPRETLARVRVIIHEGSAASDGRTPALGALLYDSEARSGTPVATDYSPYTVTQHLSLADRTWQVDIAPLVNPVNPLNQAAVAVILAVSLAASVLLFWLASTVATSESRGAELARTNAALEVENAERKRAEEKAARFYAMVDNSTEYISMASPDGKVFYLNPAGRRMAGIAQDADIGSINWRDLFDDENWKLRLEVALPTLRATGHWEGEIRMRNLDTGRTLDLLVHAFKVEDSRGAPLCVATVQRDVTETKRTGEELLHKERLLSESQRLGHTGSWFYDLAGPMTWSDEMYRLFGVTSATVNPSAESLISVIHPDDRQSMLTWIAAAAAGEKPIPLEFRVVMPDGTSRFMRGGGDTVFDATNRPLYMAGMVQDITERKLAELEREKFVALIENSPDFIGMATLEGKPFYVNTPGRELVGLDRDIDVSSTSISEYFDGDTAALLQNIGIPATFATGGWTGEGKLRHFKTHALIPVHIHSILVKDPKTGQPICIATIERDITDIKKAERKLEKANRELLHVSRLAGMAEIATGVLHNVGNVLNSVNVSADRIAEKVRRLSPASLVKVSAMLREHAHDLPDFLARDPQGRELPGYLSALVGQLAEPQKDILPEVAALRKNVEHIREIVRTQQAYAGAQGVLETVSLTDLVEDAIRINDAAFARHEVQVIREYSQVPSFPMEKHKVLQILVNLLGNAKSALDKQPDSKVTVRVETSGDGAAKVSVTDNGVGIAPENLTHIFQHGFTTRKDGHGFGLHSGALAASEMGGSLTASSGGPGKGAVFTLELPCPALKKAA